MTFVPQKLSVTASASVCKTHLRSKELPCFSMIPNATKPFFKQWYIHAVDVTKIMFVSYGEARRVVEELRCFYGKSKRDVVTVDEFCAFTGISKSYVRMHLISRVMEHELRSLLSNNNLLGKATSCKL